MKNLKWRFKKDCLGYCIVICVCNIKWRRFIDLNVITRPPSKTDLIQRAGFISLLLPFLCLNIQIVYPCMLWNPLKNFFLLSNHLYNWNWSCLIKQSLFWTMQVYVFQVKWEKTGSMSNEMTTADWLTSLHLDDKDFT